jgi:prepilin-type processing-associated H-X9-DG protein
LGLHNYHSTNDKFPIGNAFNFAGLPTGNTTWNGMSAVAQMLGYLEQSQVYNAINFSLACNATQNTTCQQTVINVFLCPSDGNATKGNNWNSYVASQGTTAQGNPARSTGLFAANWAYGLRDIIDGSSNTVAYSEILVGNSQSARYRGNGTNGATITGTADAWQAPAQVQSDLQSCNTAFMSSSSIKTTTGQWWILGSEGYTMFMTIVPPNSTQYPWTECRTSSCSGCSPDSNFYTNAASNHSGGTNVLMGDGSVKFVKSSISQNVWWGVGTRANGEVISADAY